MSAGSTFDADQQALARLGTLAADWGVRWSEQVAERIHTYAKLVMHWTATVNLTGARSAAELLDEHVPDSVAMAAATPPGSHVIDVGSGGGLPAVPFAVLRPDCTVVMLEPRSRRAAFLRTAKRELSLSQTSVVECRLDADGPTSDFGGPFDVASSKATFEAAAWAERAGFLLKSGGAVLVFSTREERVAGAERVWEYEVGRSKRRILSLVRNVPRGTI